MRLPILRGSSPLWLSTTLWSLVFGWAQGACAQEMDTRDPCLHHEDVDEAVVVITFAQPALQEALGQATTQALQNTLLEGFLLCPPNSPAGASASATVWISEVAPNSSNWADSLFTAAPPVLPIDGNSSTGVQSDGVVGGANFAGASVNPATSPTVPTDTGTGVETDIARAPETTTSTASKPAAVSETTPPEDVDLTSGAAFDLVPSKISSHLRIAISDHVTAKIVMRDLRLTDFPQDSWPLALAIACDELLRASWLELSITPRHGATHAPMAIRETVERDVKQATQAQRFPGTLFVYGALNWYSGGATLFGAGLGVRKRFGKWGGSLSLGGRRGQWHPSDDGRGRLSTINFNGFAEYLVVDDGETEVRLRFGPSGLIAYGAGDNPSAKVVVRNRVGVGTGINAGISGAVQLFQPLGLLWSLDLGYALRAVALEDSRRTLTSTKGLEIQVTIGLELGR